MKRPEIDIEYLKEIDQYSDMPKEVIEQVAISIKYEGYLKRQMIQIEQFRRMEEIAPEDIDYKNIQGLSLEARQKLDNQSPSP